MGVIAYRILVKEEPYFAGYTRVCIAMFATVLLIKFSTSTPFLELFVMKRFYFAACFGLLLAITIIETTHWITFWLDKVYNWQVHRTKRLILQILFGVVGVVYLDVWLVRGIYFMLDQNFDRGGFMHKILPINVVLLIALNVLFFFRRYDHTLFHPKRWLALLLYRRENEVSFVEAEVIHEQPFGSYYLTHAPLKTQKYIHTSMPYGLLMPVADQVTECFLLTINGYIQSTKYTFALDEVLCIKTGALYGDIFLKSGRVCNMHYRGKTLRKYLDPNQFVEIRSGVFYALDAIKGKRKQENKRFVLLKPEFNNVEVDKAISRRFFAHFDTCFAAYKKLNFQMSGIN